ncbi:MAG: phytanoyl-CoA dioxygenase family protein [Gammaproteobacteria bacterium]|nr:phytanoyl-CoA dioxygenase family protein [Gammaproteobacteria bacterium]
MKLTPQQIRDFSDIGWIAIPDLFTLEELNVMRNCFDDLLVRARKLQTTQNSDGSYFVLGNDGDEVIIKRVVWAGGCQPDLLKVGADPRILGPALQLLGSDSADHLLNQAHFKRPGDGVRFDWHQDIIHRERGPGTWEDVNGKGSYVQTALCVDDMTSKNGPLMFVKGSSKWGKVDFGAHDYDREYTPNWPAEFDESDIVTVTASAGSVLFFGPYTAHASFENNSNTSRRVLINGYAYPGANHFVYPGNGSGRRLRLPAE